MKQFLSLICLIVLMNATANVGFAITDFVLRESEPGGVCVTVDMDNVEFAAAMAMKKKYLVHMLFRDEALVQKVNDGLQTQGLLGRVSAKLWDGEHLPYTENLVTVLVVNGTGGEKARQDNRNLKAAEMFRVVQPYGLCVVGNSEGDDGVETKVKRQAADFSQAGFGESQIVNEAGKWVSLRKSKPTEIDEWGHYLHGPDGNPVSQDQIVGPPEFTQWRDAPLHLRAHDTISSLNAVTTSRGRLYYLEDKAPIAFPGDNDVPDNWCLRARNAYNGVLLWELPIKEWGWRVFLPSWNSKRWLPELPMNLQYRFVAVGDVLFATLGYNAPISKIDGRSGEILHVYEGTEGTSEIIAVGENLIATLRRNDGLFLGSFSAESGKQQWEAGPFTGVHSLHAGKAATWPTRRGEPYTITQMPGVMHPASNGKVVVVKDKNAYLAFDLKTGKPLWKSAVVEADRVLARGALIVTDQHVIACRAGARLIDGAKGVLVSLDVNTGEKLWEQKLEWHASWWEAEQNVFLIEGKVWAYHSAEFGTSNQLIKRGSNKKAPYPKEFTAFDPATGAVVDTIDLGLLFPVRHHHRCYRDKATPNHIIASYHFATFLDLHGDEHDENDHLRAGCKYGFMPANGMLYKTPDPCRCSAAIKVLGLAAFSPDPTIRFPDSMPQEENPLVKGPAFGKVGGEATETGDVDWAFFRGNLARSGANDAASLNPQGELRQVWEVECGESVSPPVIYQGAAYAATPENNSVVAVDLKSGRMKWRFIAESRIDSPPACYRGAIHFGSNDGWVYCLRAGDGALAWKFRAAPVDRFLYNLGRLESAAPVPGSVAVADGKVFFAAGNSPFLDYGLSLFSLDCQTGEVVSRYTLNRSDFRNGVNNDVPQIDGKTLFVNNRGFDLDLKPVKGLPSLDPETTFLDNSYFRRSPWYFQDAASGGAKVFGGQVAIDGESAYYFQIANTTQVLSMDIFVIPGRGTFTVNAIGKSKKKPTWSANIPVLVKALAVGRDALVAAGNPDVIDKQDPLGAYEGRLGGTLHLYDKRSGEAGKTLPLSSPPVYSGIALVDDTVVLALEGGKLVCLRP